MDMELQDIEPFKQKVVLEEDQDQQNLRSLYERKEESCKFDHSLLSIRSMNYGQSNEQQQQQLQQEQSILMKHDEKKGQSNNLNSQSYQASQQDIQIMQNKIQNFDYSLDNKQSFQKIQDISQNQSFQIDYVDKINNKEFKNSSFDLNKKRVFVNSNKNIITVGSSAKKRPMSMLKPSKEINFILKIKNRLIEFYLNNTDLGRRVMLKNKKIRQSINDKSDFQEELNENRIKMSLNRLVSQLNKLKVKVTQQIPLFNPQNRIIFALQIAFCLVNCFYFLFYSAILTFGVKEPYQDLITQIIITIWILEIFIKINTAVYINTDLVKDRELIFMIYIQKNLFYDIIPLFSLSNRFENSIIQIILTVATFVKLKNVLNELIEIQKQLCMEIKNYFFVQIFNLIANIFILGHIIALMYFLVGLFEINYLGETESWFNPAEMGQNNFWWKTYLIALYWSLTLMATGSNTATTIFQTFFTSFIMLFTTIFFGYFVSTIGIILEERDEQELAQRRDTNIINELMRKRNISKNLQRRVNLDLEYFYLKNFKKNQEQNEDVLGRISQNLNDQLQIEYFREILKKFSFLPDNFSEETIEKLCLCMVEENYIPNQIIFQENDSQNLGILIILEGSIEMTKQISKSQNVSKTLSVLGKGQSTGHMSFFTGQFRTATAKSKSFTTLIRISRDSFTKIISQNENDFQKFNYIKDKIQLYNNYESIRVQCGLCKKFTHYQSDCPLVHYNRQQYQNKLDFFEKIQQSRSFMQRKVIYYNSLLLVKRLKESSEQFEFLQRIETSKNSDSQSGDSEQSSNEQIEQNTKVEDLGNLEKQLTLGLDLKKQSSLSKIHLEIENSAKHIQNEQQEQTKVSTGTSKQKSAQHIEQQSQRNIKNNQAEEFVKRPTQFILKQRKVQDNLEVEVQFVQSSFLYENPWIYDKQKDYSIYFPEGNLKPALCKLNRSKKKNKRQNSRKIKLNNKKSYLV